MEQPGWPAGAELVASSWMLAAQRPMTDAPPCPIPIARRIRAAAAAGYCGIGLNLGDLASMLANPGVTAVRAMMEDAGIRHLELEPLTGWWNPDADPAQWQKPLDLMLDVASRLPVRQIKVNGHFGEDPPAPDAMREGFAHLARLAREAGTVIALEPVAFSNIADVSSARDVIGDSAGRGGGLTLDCWHFARGGLGLAEIHALSAADISGVEISNVGGTVIGSLFEDTLDHRLPPDRGVYDVAAFLRAIAATGYRGAVGCEVLSTALRDAPLERALRETAAAAARICAEAA